jgi:hypothetical protein
MEVDSINPNVNVMDNANTEGKIEMNSGSGPLTFDELDEVLRTKRNSKHKKESEPEDKSKHTKDLTSDDDKGKKESKPKEAKESKSKDQEESEESEKPAPTEEQVRKKIKAKFADSELDLDEEALVPVKINGKEEMVPIKELLGNYSGKVAWDKRFTELSKSEKSQKMQEMKLRQAAEQVKGIMSEQDPDIRMWKLSQIAGVDPIEYRNKFFNDNISMLEKWYNMSDDERKADALSYESKIHKQRADTLEAQQKNEHANQALRQKLESLRASHQVSEDEFLSQYDQINQMVTSGQLDESHLNPEQIIATVEKDRMWNEASKELLKLDLGWTEQVMNQRLFEFVENAHKLGLKPTDAAEMVSEIWGDKKTQKLIKEKQAQQDEFKNGKKPVEQVKRKNEEPLFFDEIL